VYRVFNIRNPSSSSSPPAGGFEEQVSSIIHIFNIDLRELLSCSQHQFPDFNILLLHKKRLTISLNLYYTIIEIFYVFQPKHQKP